MSLPPAALLAGTIIDFSTAVTSAATGFARMRGRQQSPTCFLGPSSIIKISPSHSDTALFRIKPHPTGVNLPMAPPVPVPPPLSNRPLCWIRYPQKQLLLFLLIPNIPFQLDIHHRKDESYICVRTSIAGSIYSSHASQATASPKKMTNWPALYFLSLMASKL